MVEHSICQPGLPWPQGDSQYGSRGFDLFQSAKSLESRFDDSLPEEPWDLGWELHPVFHYTHVHYFNSYQCTIYTTTTTTTTAIWPEHLDKNTNN